MSGLESTILILEFEDRLLGCKVLLGIAFLGLLAFLLYHYKLKSLEGRFEFRKVLYWSEWGKCVSASQSMLVVGLTMASAIPHFMTGHMTILKELLFPFDLLWEADIFMYGNLLSVVFLASIIFLPLLFASLIHIKIIGPFEGGELPARGPSATSLKRECSSCSSSESSASEWSTGLGQQTSYPPLSSPSFP